MSWKTFWATRDDADKVLNSFTTQGWHIVIIAPFVRKDGDFGVFVAAYLPPDINPRERFGIEKKDLNSGIFQ